MTEAERKAWNAAIEEAIAMLDRHDRTPCKPTEAWTDHDAGIYLCAQVDAALSWQRAIRSLAKPEAE